MNAIEKLIYSVTFDLQKGGLRVLFLATDLAASLEANVDFSVHGYETKNFKHCNNVH